LFNVLDQRPEPRSAVITASSLLRESTFTLRL
jgi:hypothetical protein